MRKEITEDQITELMRAIPRAEEVDRLRGEVEKLTRERDEARSRETDYGEGFGEGWAAAQKGAAAEVERLREALTDMLTGWRYIRETYGDLAGIGWDRAESKAQEALEAKP